LLGRVPRASPWACELRTFGATTAFGLIHLSRKQDDL
jgi:hypothetical protein